VRVEAKSAKVPSVIDFANGALVKLSPANPQELVPAIAPLLIPGEEIVSPYKAMRDFLVFTSRRLIVVNVQGMTGKKNRLCVLAVLQGPGLLD
jgi:Bacterial PH domain